MNFEIVPGIGIGPVKLGMSRDEVIDVLGASNHSNTKGSSATFYDYSFQVEFTDGKVSFIGVSQHPSYQLNYLGRNAFDIESKELFSLISNRESASHKYTDTEYVFPDQIITLWDADHQYDRLGGEERSVWAQIGLGSKVYLDDINRITNKDSG